MNTAFETAIRQKLAEHLPEWEAAVIGRVTGGQNPDCYRLTVGRAQALLKYDRSARDDFVTSRTEEARIQSNAAEQGIAPPVLFADKNCIVTTYVSGTVLTREAIREPAVLEQCGLLLRKVHSLPRASVSSDLLSAARLYAAQIGDDETTARCLSAVASAPASDDALCHNDVVIGNLLNTNSLLLIDWEYARNHSPLFDLATVIAHHGLLAHEARILLDAYEPSGISQAALLQYQAAYHALHWLWLASRDVTDPRLPGIAAQI